MRISTNASFDSPANRQAQPVAVNSMRKPPRTPNAILERHSLSGWFGLGQFAGDVKAALQGG